MPDEVASQQPAPPSVERVFRALLSIGVDSELAHRAAEDLANFAGTNVIAQVKAHIDSKFGSQRAEFEGLRAEFEGLRAEFEGLRAEFEGLNGKFEVLNGKFEVLNTKFEGLRAEIKADINGLSRAINILSALVITLIVAVVGAMFTIATRPVQLIPPPALAPTEAPAATPVEPPVDPEPADPAAAGAPASHPEAGAEPSANAEGSQERSYLGEHLAPTSVATRPAGDFYEQRDAKLDPSTVIPDGFGTPARSRSRSLSLEIKERPEAEPRSVLKSVRRQHIHPLKALHGFRFPNLPACVRGA